MARHRIPDDGTLGLLAAYLAAGYRSKVGGAWLELRIGQAAPPALEAAVHAQAGAEATWTLVTAWNPQSQPRDDTGNRAADASLQSDLDALGLSYDLFTRTTTGNHYKTVQELFTTLHRNGYILQQKTLGAISPSTGRTLPDRYIEGTCPHCGFDSARGDHDAAVDRLLVALAQARRTTGEGYTFHWPVAWILESLARVSLHTDAASSQRWAETLLDHASAVEMRTFIDRATGLLTRAPTHD